jgi:hypothetical protein
MPIHVFRSTDVGAPQLTGIAGSMIAVLDACLVNGYNTKSVTITRSGETATVTSTAHGYVLDQVVEISGAAETEYNGLFKVASVPDANTFTVIVTGNPATPATGAISCKVAGAGWTKDFTATNLAAYRGPVGTTRYFLRVNDTFGNLARVRGYESMTAISTGTGLFPTVAQFAGDGLVWWKSDASTSATRPWTLFTDGKCIHLVHHHNATSTYISLDTFGDIKSYRSGDVHNCILIGSENTTNAVTTNSAPGACYSLSLGSNSAGVFMARDYFGEGGSFAPQKIVNGSFNSQITSTFTNNVFGSRGVRFPNPADGGLVVSKIFIGTPEVLRGELPGVLCPMHFRPFSEEFRFDGQGELLGDSYMAVNVASGSAASPGSAGQVLFKVTGNWD